MYYINKNGQVYIGDMVESDRVATDSEIEVYYGSKLDISKNNKLNQINLIYQKKSKIVKNDTPTDEVLTWDIQKNEAEAFEKDEASATPFIDGIASARKIDRIFLLNKVLEKTKIFNDYMAVLTGTRQFYEDQIKSAQSIKEVEEIIWI